MGGEGERKHWQASEHQRPVWAGRGWNALDSYGPFTPFLKCRDTCTSSPSPPPSCRAAADALLDAAATAGVRWRSAPDLQHRLELFTRRSLRCFAAACHVCTDSDQLAQLNEEMGLQLYQRTRGWQPLFDQRARRPQRETEQFRALCAAAEVRGGCASMAGERGRGRRRGGARGREQSIPCCAQLHAYV